MSENLQFEPLPDEEMLFYSPNKDRWENYRFDLMAYIAIGLGVVPYTYVVITSGGHTKFSEGKFGRSKA